MSKTAMNLVKGVTLGMVAGATAGLVGKKMLDNNKKSIKKKANRALKEMGSMLDTASYMFK
ncbi:MAG: hypothetical protein II225_01720 [Ruminococcus sp.]|nr:hypothetical protein [Ruminococcus sp.]